MTGRVAVGPEGGRRALRRTPRQARAHERVERLLVAAEQVFVEVGYPNATTNMIAARSDSSIGSLYEFFPNKAALAQGLADRYVERIGSLYETVVVDQPGVLGDELVHHIVEAVDSFYRQNPGAVTLLHGRYTSPELASAGETLQVAFIRQIEEILAARLPALPSQRRRMVSGVIAEIARGLLLFADQVARSQRRAVIDELIHALLGYIEHTMGAHPAVSESGPR